MKISVIIPTYNMGEYIGACIENIMHQTLNDIEVICIDDGSTDNTVNIVRRLQEKYSNLLYIWQENAGSGKARNMGIMKARGEFVAFMDADDFYYAEDVLELLYKKAKEKRVNICGGSACNYRDGMIVKVGLRKSYVFEEEGYVKYRDYSVAYGFWRFIYKRTFLMENNIFFPNYLRFQDPPFFVTAMSKAEEFYAVKEICYCYRKAHKKVIYNRQKIKDYASGIRDVLILSKEYGYPLLHTEIINKIHNELSPMLYEEIAKGAKELEPILMEINENIDESLVCRNKVSSNNLYLLSLDEIIPYVTGAEERKNKFTAELRNSKAVYVYGAGVVGRRVLKFLSDQDVKVEAVLVTSKNQNPDYVENVPVQDLEAVTIKENDIVLIATFPYLHEEIAKELSDRNVTNIKKIDLEEFIMYEKEFRH